MNRKAVRHQRRRRIAHVIGALLIALTSLVATSAPAAAGQDPCIAPFGDDVAAFGELCDDLICLPSDGLTTASLEECHECDPGQQWDIALWSCVDICSDGEVWSDVYLECVSICSDGEQWSDDAQDCVSLCQPGWVWTGRGCQPDCEFDVSGGISIDPFCDCPVLANADAAFDPCQCFLVSQADLGFDPCECVSLDFGQRGIDQDNGFDPCLCIDFVPGLSALEHGDFDPCQCLDIGADDVAFDPCQCLQVEAEGIGFDPCWCYAFGDQQLGPDLCLCIDGHGDDDARCGTDPYISKDLVGEIGPGEGGLNVAHYEIVFGLGLGHDGPIHDVGIRDVLPPGAVVLDVSATEGSCSDRKVVRPLGEDIGEDEVDPWCGFGTLDPGDEVVMWVVVDLAQCGDNTAVATWWDPDGEEGNGRDEGALRPSGDIGGRSGIVIPEFRAQGVPTDWLGEDSDTAPGLPCAPPPPTPTPAQPSIGVTSSPSPSSNVGNGDTVTFTTTITNTGTTTLTNIVVTNDVGSNGSGGGFTANRTAVGTAATLTSNGASKVIDVVTTTDALDLAPGASTTVTSTYLVTEGDLPGPLTSTILVSANGVTASTTSIVGLISQPALVVAATPDANPVVWDPDAPATITWTYVLTNIGDVTLTGLTLDDSTVGSVDLAGVSSLAPGQSHTATATHTVTPGDALAGVVNSAITARGLVFSGAFVQALASSDVAVVAPTAPPPAEPEEEAEVLGEVVDREPDPAPAAQPQVETLPATGEHDAGIAALALLMTLFGLLMIVGVEDRSARARREQV